MKRAAFALAAIVLAAPAIAQTRFLSGAEDVPLPPAWSETDSATFFGDGGSLLEASARGPGARDRIAAFYRETLPALGWAARPGDALSFQRGRERLSIVLGDEAGRTSARFVITAAPASMALD